MNALLVWGTIIGLSCAIGLVCARWIHGRAGLFAAGGIPWLALLGAILATEYLSPYSGGGASMWPIAQLVGGTVAAACGITAYRWASRAR